MISMALVQDIYIFFTFHRASEHGYLTTLMNLYLFVVLIGSDSICVESLIYDSMERYYALLSKNNI